MGGRPVRPAALTRYASAGAISLALGACATPGSTPTTVASDASAAKIGDICSSVMGFDVSGMYYFKCRDYLRAHERDAPTPIPVKAETAEHKACHQIGLQDDTHDYADCVETM